MPAGSKQDVVNAWNEERRPFFFGSITGTETCTIGSIYSGEDFDTDCPAFMTAIQHNDNVKATDRANPEYLDIVSAVLEDPAWYS